jgi:hypothetical protein
MDADEYKEMEKRFRYALARTVAEFANEGLALSVILDGLLEEVETCRTEQSYAGISGIIGTSA